MDEDRKRYLSTKATLYQLEKRRKRIGRDVPVPNWPAIREDWEKGGQTNSQIAAKWGLSKGAIWTRSFSERWERKT